MSIILEYKRVNVNVNVNVSKLLGVHFHQHLNWDEHVKAACKSRLRNNTNNKKT